MTANANAFHAAHAVTLDAILKFSDNQPFLLSLAEQFNQRGSLSEKQLEAAERAIERLKNPSTSKFVGEIGKRLQLTITIDKCITPDAGYGRFTPPIFLCHDVNGNRIVYRGNSSGSGFPMTGETAIISATVKKHEEFRGENQTTVSRPKIIQMTETMDQKYERENPIPEEIV